MGSTVCSRVWAVMILLLLVFTSMFVGMDLADGDWQGAIINGILLLFWVFAAVWFHFMALREQKSDIEFKQHRDKLDSSLKSLLDDTLGKIKEDLDHDTRLENALHQAHHEICGERPARVSEYKKVEARFHEIAGDHYIKLEKSENGKPNVTISDQPFETKPARKKAPVKKPVAKKTVTTKKGK